MIAQLEKQQGMNEYKLPKCLIPEGLDCVSDYLKLYDCGPSAAVYFIVKYERVIYVGQSISMGARLRQQCKRFGDRDVNAYYLQVYKDDLLRVEAAFIRLLKPQFNGTCKKDPTQSDLDLINNYFKPRKQREGLC